MDRPRLVFMHKKYNKVAVLIKKPHYNYHNRGRDLMEPAVHAVFVGGKFALEPENPYYDEVKAKLLKNRQITVMGDVPKPSVPEDDVKLDREKDPDKKSEPILNVGGDKKKLLVTDPADDIKARKVKE